MKLTEVFEEYKNQDFIEDDSKLLDLFDQLGPVSCDEMYSPWSGGSFQTGHWALKVLSDIRWYGKWFRSKLAAAPLICFDERGNLFSNQMLGGEGTLWMAEFRGKVSATLIYDCQPMFNHFRKVDDNTLMGLMDEKKLLTGIEIVPNDRYYFFYLQRLTKFPARFVTDNQTNQWRVSRRASLKGR